MLAIGIVVDDAIVVLENIYTKVENKMHPVDAATKGSAEIFFAIISTTVTLVSVFLPIIFLQGITGRLFREFGVVIAGSVLISAFVALTLTPMLSAKFLKRRETHNWFYNKTEPFFVKMNKGYANLLSSFLKKRYYAFLIVGAMIIAAVVLFRVIPSELAPLEDRNRLQISVTAPEGTSYDYMDSFMKQLVEFIADTVHEREAIISLTAPGFGGTGSANSGNINLILTHSDERDISQQQIADKLSVSLAGLTEARIYVTQQQTIGGGRGGLPVQYVIQAPNFEKLKGKVPLFIEAARNHPAFAVVDVNLKFNKPELKISIDRERAKNLGVATLDIAQTIQAAFSGQRFGYFIMNGKQYQVIGQLLRESRNEPIDLRSLFVKNNRGELIQLDNVISVEEQSTPPQLYRFNRYESATISAGLSPGYTIGQGIEAMDEIAGKVLDESFATALYGTSKDFAESSSSLLFAFFFALVLIYLVLAAQFESFRDPFIILFTVPLALSGALISLWYFYQTFNTVSYTHLDVYKRQRYISAKIYSAGNTYCQIQFRRRRSFYLR